MENSYDKLPSEFLAGFYCYINLNIKKGILSDAMYHEIDLIKQVAIKRGISLDYLHKKWSMMK